MEPLRLILITGLSGSGKSSVAKSFEDLGHFVVDNLPLPLLRHFLRDPYGQVEGYDKIAVVTDVRTPGLASELPRLLAEMDRRNIEPVLLFLEASTEVLTRRFSETRRRHPMTREGPVIEAIEKERELLAELRGMADRIFDTSEWTIHEMRAEVHRQFGAGRSPGPGMNVTLVSFGYKYGIPHGTDLMFDVRYLPNPHFVPELRELSGLDGAIRAYLEQGAGYRELVEKLQELLLYLFPRFSKENRSYLTIALGCTGGRHRSVAVTEELAGQLKSHGWPVLVHHRDIER